jgi:cobalt-zinc-cadmium efflux system outer membrane protein
MRAFSIILIGALTISAPQVSRAEQPASPPLTLTGAIREALLANPELVALGRDYEAAKAAVPAARFLDAPMVETQIWGWPVTTVNPAMVDMYMFLAEQELPGRGKRAAREVVADREAEMSRRQIAVRANDILNAVKQTYVELLLARATVSLYEQQTPILRDIADAATLRFASGHVGQHDTVKSVVELARLQADAIEWRERAGTAEVRLATLLGRGPESLLPVLAPADSGIPDESAAESAAAQRHPEVQLALTTVAREEAELARVRGERKPDFVVGGGYMLQPGGAGAWTARGGISWPNAPWSRGKLNTEIAAQEKRVEAARAHRDATLASVRQSVREATVRLEAARQRVDLLEAAVMPHVEHDFDVARASYAAGRAEFADLLESERALLTTRMDVIAARAGVQRAIADVELAVGDIPENE